MAKNINKFCPLIINYLREVNAIVTIILHHSNQLSQLVNNLWLWLLLEHSAKFEMSPSFCSCDNQCVDIQELSHAQFSNLVLIGSLYGWTQ